MKITDLLSKESVLLNAQPENKKETIDQAVKLMANRGNLKDLEVYAQKVFAREEEGTTGVGEGVAIPHGKSSAVEAPGLAAMTIPAGVDYESLDGEPVKLVFLIAAPDNEANVHLAILAKLATLLMDSKFISDLVSAKTPEAFLEIIDKAEAAKDAEEAAKAAAQAQPVQDLPTAVKIVNLLGVTGCPTGIAHTYMAAESLEKKAKELGYNIKVETRGSGGAKNVLTDAEIAAADGIIVAADTDVPMDRFDGKKVLVTRVADGISKPGELIDRVLSSSTKPYKASGTQTKSSSDDGKGSAGHAFYKQLMNGVSHMLPFVVGGGILIALAFLIDGLSVDLNSLPMDQRANFGSITPVAAMLKGIGGTSFGFMLPVLAGFIAMSIADRPGLAVGFVGGAIAAGGTSGFLGAFAAGFISGWVVKMLIKVTENLPRSLAGIRPILLYPVLGILSIGLIMHLAVEPVVGAINTGLNSWLASMGGSSSVILGFLLAAMMAIDMGGPFNKAAYVFGTASIAAGNYNIMAAVMIGGMTPPIALALASYIFKDKFTDDQRKSAPANILMGLSFITEGAIPFAAQDPLRVIPACMIGSGVAGALSMAFGCTLMAPHGGMFVFPVVGNALMYILALVIGTAASTVALGILRKKVD